MSTHHASRISSANIPCNSTHPGRTSQRARFVAATCLAAKSHAPHPICFCRGLGNRSARGCVGTPKAARRTFPQSPFVVPNPALQLIWQVTEFGDRVNLSV